MRDVTRQPAGSPPLREAEHHKDEAGQTFHFPKINAEKQSLDYPLASWTRKEIATESEWFLSCLDSGPLRPQRRSLFTSRKSLVHPRLGKFPDSTPDFSFACTIIRQIDKNFTSIGTKNDSVFLLDE